MNPEADRIAAKSYWRGDEEEQIKSQEGTWVWDDVPVIWTCPYCVFFQVWLSGLQTSSVALKFCDLPRAQCLCSSHSTWLSYTTTVSISGFRNMTWQNTHYQVGHLYIVCVKNQTKECSTKGWVLLSNILSSQGQHEGETSFGYQQILSNSKISTGCCDSELFTMQLTTWGRNACCHYGQKF